MICSGYTPPPTPRPRPQLVAWALVDGSWLLLPRSAS